MGEALLPPGYCRMRPKAAALVETKSPRGPTAQAFPAQVLEAKRGMPARRHSGPSQHWTNLHKPPFPQQRQSDQLLRILDL